MSGERSIRLLVVSASSVGGRAHPTEPGREAATPFITWQAYRLNPFSASLTLKLFTS